MAIPSIFTQKGGEAVASYDWFDLASGTGYRKYYLTCATTSTATTYFLNSELMDSSPYLDSYTMPANSAMALRIDRDFDLEFKNPVIIQGNLLTNFLIKTYASPTDSTEVYAIINIYHVDLAATETLLGTATSTTSAATNDATSYQRVTFNIPLARKKIAIGEKLRVNVLIYGSHSGNDLTDTVSVYFDPTEISAISGQNSDFIVQVPFRIDI
jgi:hypothetical protein